jgi:Sybindin-like family
MSFLLFSFSPILRKIQAAQTMITLYQWVRLSVCECDSTVAAKVARGIGFHFLFFLPFLLAVSRAPLRSSKNRTHLSLSLSRTDSDTLKKPFPNQMQFFSGSTVTESSLLPAAPPGTVAGGAGNNAHMLYIFNRAGVCLLYREWNRPLRTLDPQQDHKLMFGLLFSLRSFTTKIDPTT